MKRLNKVVFWLVGTVLALGVSCAQSQATPTAPTAVEILKRVDAVRNPLGSYEMKVRIGDSLFEAWIASGARTLVRTLAPSRDRGRDLLMLGEEMWAYIPNLKRAVRVSLSQKLTGQASNGDISRMRWSEDYEPSLESSDVDEDRESDGPQWVLSLRALKKGLTYERLRVWVSRRDYHPLRAEYMTQAGKVLKRARFEGYQMIAGRERPTRLLIESAVDSEDRSTLVVESMQERSFSDSMFNPQGLGR